MICLNSHELAWYNHNQHLLNIPEGTSAAAEIFVRSGIGGISQFHRAIVARDINKIQQLLDS